MNNLRILTTYKLHRFLSFKVGDSYQPWQRGKEIDIQSLDLSGIQKHHLEAILSGEFDINIDPDGTIRLQTRGEFIEGEFFS